MGKSREEVVDYLDRHLDLDGEPLDQVVEQLQDYQRRVVEVGGIEGSGFIDFEYYGYDGAFEFKLKYRRLESDREYERRQVKEAKERERKAKAKERRRKEFEKLKREFGE